MPVSAPVIAHLLPWILSARKWSRAAASVPSLRWRRKQLWRSRRARKRRASLASTSAILASASGMVGIVRLLDVSNDPPVIPAPAVIAEELDALARRDGPEEALALDVADDRGQQVRRLAEDRHRPGHEAAVLRRASPLVPIRELLRDLPEAQGVVAQVIVELDQAGKDRSAGRDHRNRLRSRRGAGAAASCTATIAPWSM